MSELSPITLAIHQWIRDDAPVSMKMTITPALVSALSDRIDAARSEAQPSGYDGSKSLGERLCEALASAGLLTGLAGASPVINAQFEKAALTFTASLSDASPSSGDE